MKTIEDFVVENILALLKAKGYSQSWLSKKANIKGPSLSQMLNKKRPIENKTRKMIAGALGVPAESLRKDPSESPEKQASDLQR